MMFTGRVRVLLSFNTWERFNGEGTTHSEMDIIRAQWAQHNKEHPEVVSWLGGIAFRATFGTNARELYLSKAPAIVIPLFEEGSSDA